MDHQSAKEPEHAQEAVALPLNNQMIAQTVLRQLQQWAEHDGYKCLQSANCIRVYTEQQAMTVECAEQITVTIEDIKQESLKSFTFSYQQLIRMRVLYSQFDCQARFAREWF